MRTQERGAMHGAKKKLLAIAVSAALAMFVVAMAGCQPQSGSGDQKDSEKEAEQSATVVVSDFQQVGAGDFTDADGFNAQYMNDANRGCNSCHADLWSVIEGDVSAIQHVLASPAGYGKVYSWTDCTTCHTFNRALGAPRLDTRIHNIHYSNAEFTDDQNGNCWSCHDTNAAGAMVMWDEYKYTAEMSGYVNAADSGLLTWLEHRGRNNQSAIDVVIDSTPQIEVELSQPVGEESNQFVANNHVVPEIDGEEWTLKVTGVNNPRSFTLEELKALPQTEATVTQDCFTNANDGVLIGNIPVTGVLIADLIEACGGLVEGNTTLAAMGTDGWGHNSSVEFLLGQNAMIGLQYWGHDLTVNQGYPAAMVVPGVSGLFWDKWLDTIEFNTAAPSAQPWFLYDMAKMKREFQGTICAGWLTPDKDGEEHKVGEAVAIDGYAYLNAYAGHELAQIAFSTDYGNTWVTVDVPESFDQMQWTYFSGTWTPETTGTYVLQVKAIDAAGSEQYVAASTIVKVVE